MQKMSLILSVLLIAGIACAEQISTSSTNRLNEGWWKQRFEEKQTQAAQGNWPLVFMGDSITHGWDNAGKTTREKYFAGQRILNLGFGGDRTEHVLWHIDQADWQKIDAKVLMLMIGTNNTGHRKADQEKPEDTVAGIKAILDRLAEKTPQTKILLLAIFPRSEKASDTLRMRNAQVNAVLPTLADNKHVFWMDINARLLEADGATLSREIMPDLLHPREKGYTLWAEAVKPKLDELLKP